MRCRDQSPDYGTELSPTRAPSRLFFVRIWREQVEDGFELRGDVRDAATGAFRAFRDWSELVTFLTDCAREHAQAARVANREAPGSPRPI